MLLDLEYLRDNYMSDVTGILHLGANLGQEAPEYNRLFPDVPVWWVEAHEGILPELRENVEKYGHKVIPALVYSEDDISLEFRITNYKSMSSSIYEFGTHTSFSPDTVFVDKFTLSTRTVDSLADEFMIKANFLNMDLQGAELHALLGAKNFLDNVDFINTEINSDEVYVGCCKVDQLDELLVDFDRVETNWVPGQGWGDGLYVRRTR